MYHNPIERIENRHYEKQIGLQGYNFLGHRYNSGF